MGPAWSLVATVGLLVTVGFWVATGNIRLAVGRAICIAICAAIYIAITLAFFASAVGAFAVFTGSVALFASTVGTFFFVTLFLAAFGFCLGAGGCLCDSR